MRGQAKSWSDRAELLGITVPGFRSRNLTPFSNATSILGPKNGPDFGTVFVTNRARIFVAASANQEAVIRATRRKPQATCKQNDYEELRHTKL